MLFKIKPVIAPKKILTLLNLDRLFKFIYNQNYFINLMYFKSTRFYNNKLSIQYEKTQENVRTINNWILFSQSNNYQNLLQKK
jgi:hypothetical protein